MTFVVNSTYTNSSALGQLGDPRSLAITTGGLYIIMDEDLEGTLTFVIMNPDGSSATGTKPINTSLSSDGTYYNFLSATPTGSMIFIPGTTSQLVNTYQGIASSILPVTIASNSSCGGAGRHRTANHPSSHPLRAVIDQRHIPHPRPAHSGCAGRHGIESN